MEFRILDNIHSRADLKGLSFTELELLADEMREYIIDTLSQTGGHLAPNLGIVELTLAMLKVHDPEKNRIVWDVGHQCYPYKIITGRRESFCTVRTHGGISGFPKRSENPADHFGTGHASTSISAAVGFAAARNLKGEDHNVIAVIGDGALTGGLAFEGLNNAGSLNSEILVILNDNRMSISPNVGALSRYLTNIIANPMYTKLKEDAWNLLGRLSLGTQLRSIAGKVEDSLKNLIVPGMLFEQLGFEYYGPIDGHDIEEVVTVLRELKTVKKPKLLHVITEKGRGYEPAERDRPRFHGIGSFDRETGEKKKVSGIKSYTQIFGEAMVELGQQIPKLSAITAAMALGTGLDGFSEAFPDRFFDVGIAEGHAVTFASSLALDGIPVVCALYSTFLQRGYDQLIHDAALQSAPVVFALDRAGVVGADGPTHHGVFDISYLRTIPDIVISVPADEEELRHLLYTGIKYEKGPYTIRYPRGEGIGKSEMKPFEEIPIGSWEIRHQGQDKIVILATGSMVSSAVEAAMERPEITVVNCRFIKPMDTDLLTDLAKKAEHIITVEENAVKGGFGEGIAAFLKENDMDTDLDIMGIPDRFIPHGSTPRLLDGIGLSKRGILEQIDSLSER